MANKLAENIKKFWNGTSPRNAHLGQSGEAEFLLARYRALVTDRIKCRGKVVVDFGHGGGLLGLHLLADCGAARYVGYDVAERSNQVAAENLKGFENKELILLTEHRWDFAAHRPDVLVCLAVMIHFPTRAYLDNFLATVEASGARHLVLEIRDVGQGTVFQTQPYSEGCFAMQPRSCLTCATSAAHVAERLPSYRLTDKTDPAAAPTRCQVLWFTRR